MPQFIAVEALGTSALFIHAIITDCFCSSLLQAKALVVYTRSLLTPSLPVGALQFNTAVLSRVAWLEASLTVDFGGSQWCTTLSSRMSLLDALLLHETEQPRLEFRNEFGEGVDQCCF